MSSHGGDIGRYLEDETNDTPKAARPLGLDLGTNTQHIEIRRKLLHEQREFARCRGKASTASIVRRSNIAQLI